jgi:cysteine desulfurase
MSARSTVYLDCNATAPIRPEAQAAAVCALDIGANPSSVHARGRMARAAVEQARSEVARLVNALHEQVVFTSGGTEANRIAVEYAVASGCKRPIVLMTEHDSVLRPASESGLWVEAWPVTDQGVASLNWLADRLKRWDAKDGAPFVALALANSETGVIQPVAEVAAIVHAAGGTVHVDAVQAAGKLPVDFSAGFADTLAISGHKLGAPQGVGALVFGPNATVKVRRAFALGQALSAGQEQGVRPGTENLSGIAGFGAAALAALRDLAEASGQAEWRDRAAQRMKAEGAVIAGEAAPRLPGVLCAVTEGFPSEMQVMMLDLEGVMVSAGSACSSGKVRASSVLMAMGLAGLLTSNALGAATGWRNIDPEKVRLSEGLAACAVRASGGWATTEADWERFADVWVAAHERHARRRAVA